VLYEEELNDPQGKRHVGSVIWRTETVSPSSGLAPELQVRADITIPERNMSVTWKLHRNTDQSLPASHTIEIMFNLPPDFPGGGVANVPGVLMKESEQERGVPLSGLAVKVANGFVIGLSAVDTDVQRNMQLLKDRPWFDVPIVYSDGSRAILAIEKGTSGNGAFADAFASWEKSAADEDAQRKAAEATVANRAPDEEVKRKTAEADSEKRAADYQKQVAEAQKAQRDAEETAKRATDEAARDRSAAEAAKLALDQAERQRVADAAAAKRAAEEEQKVAEDKGNEKIMVGLIVSVFLVLLISVVTFLIIKAKSN
jgi:hypothetical protein